MGIGVLGTARCQHHCSPDYCVIELEALWTWYAPFCKRYCTRVKSKDHAKTLLEVPSGWDGGLEETQSSVTCSKTWSQTRKPSPLHARHDSGQLDSGMKGFPRGCWNPCNLRVTGQALSPSPGPAAEPWGGVKKADGSGAPRPRGGLAGSGFPECQLKRRSFALGCSCKRARGTRFPAGFRAHPRRWLCHGWAQLHLFWWPTNLR